ncbi:MAG TPA: AAA family ATPase, partial [Leptospiraceae bacterium]|nr:AAA family ATPase [Leptospiraceae bacterium]
MLTELRIENFGIMDEMRFHPGDGLSVLTGETGAGKSLLIQSISALLGGRLGAGVVRAGAARALIEGRFREKDEDEIVLRREVSADGRSRVFINGTQTNLAGLKARATSLIEMHGQHD